MLGRMPCGGYSRGLNELNSPHQFSALLGAAIAAFEEVHMMSRRDWFYWIFIGGIFVPAFFMFMTH